MRPFTMRYKSGTRQVAQNAFYPDRCHISGTAQEMQQKLAGVLQWDCICGEFTDHRRGDKYFLSADVFCLDCDNDATDAPAQWLTPEKIHERMPELEFWYSFSKSHMREKDVYSPRPRFHCFFPLSKPEQNIAVIRAQKRKMIELFPEFDPKALDASRFLYGVAGAAAFYFEGTLCIDELYPDLPIECEKQEKPQKPASKLIEQELAQELSGDAWSKGHRTGALLSMISTLNRKQLQPEQIKTLVRQANAEKCTPPLTEHELETELFPAIARWQVESWHRMNRQGEPIGIFQDALCRAILSRERIFIMQKAAYLYRGGAYVRDQNGNMLRSLIRDAIHEKVRSAQTINATFQYFCECNAEIVRDIQGVNMFPDHFICFQNGMLDLHTGELKAHSPDFFCINQIPHAYDSKALERYEGSAADRLIQGMMPAADDQRMFLAFCGYTLTKSTRLQKALIIFGSGGTGKSRLLSLIENAVGETNRSTVALQDLSDRFRPAELVGKLLNINADLPHEALKSIDSFKRLLGEDSVIAERKFCEPYTFRSYAKNIFATNTLPPSFDESSNALTRRLLIIKTQRAPYIENLSEGLKKSIDPFIAAAVNAYRDFLQKSAADPKYKIDSPNSQRAVQEYRLESDSVEFFLHERYTRDADSSIPRKEVYSDYCAFCTGEEIIPHGSRRFYAALREKGFQTDSRGHTGGRLVKGLKRLDSSFRPIAEYERLNAV